MMRLKWHGAISKIMVDKISKTMIKESFARVCKYLFWSGILFLISLIAGYLINAKFDLLPRIMVAILLVGTTLTFLGSILIFVKAISIFVFSFYGGRLGFFINSIVFLILGGAIYFLMSSKYVNPRDIIYFVFPFMIFSCSAILNLYKFLFGFKLDQRANELLDE